VIAARAFSGKHYAVLGLARSGQATMRALIASGARVTAWDDREEARAVVPDEVALEDFSGGDLSIFDSIVVTPGLPLNIHPIAVAAKAAGVEIIGDIELFARARAELPPHQVVGITGTNGKSTTTALVNHILKIAGVPTAMGGNIGLPILAQDPLPAGGVYVLELSSYQIDLIKSLDCDVAVLLNITPDHLDRYESYRHYAQSKGNLFHFQSKTKTAVVDRAAVQDDLMDGTVRTERLFWIDEVIVGNQADWPTLQGPHNLKNTKAASQVCRSLGISERKIEEGLRSYPGLPHRMERVREFDGVMYVNDSKATNAEAAAPALSAYTRVRWILGGRAKAETLGDTARHLDNVAAAYTIGEAGPMFARLLREEGVEVVACETLENAVKRAAMDSHPGETVLLSPAAASFDQFHDFEARGDAFRALVEGL
jgi:UDP-N-acetylmuramoylalanine--D-glutamate ligase